MTTQEEIGAHAASGAKTGLAPTIRNAAGRLLSHVRGAGAPPLLEETIPALLARQAAPADERVRVVFREQSVRRSYAGFSSDVDALARAFADLGLAKGDRLGVWSPNRYEWLLCQFATARIGVILVTINPAYRPGELGFALRQAGVSALVLARRFKSSDYVAMVQALAPELETAAPGALSTDAAPELRSVIAMDDAFGAPEAPPPGMLSFGALMAAGRRSARDLEALSSALAPTDPINIQFTSGTTGAPKGATLTHRNIVNNAAAVAGRMALTGEDALCIPVPLYHCFGMVMGALGCVASGAAMVFPGEGFAADATLAAITEEQCTALYSVPTMFIAMLDRLAAGDGGYDVSRLRTGIMAGSVCPAEIMRRVNDEMNLTGITVAYGMTETAPVSFQSHPEDSQARRCATVGRIMPHLEVKVVDADGAVTPIGVPGELLTRGYSVMAGYWGEPEKTAEAIRDGWMHTGDEAVIDEDGYCAIVGRIKDMVIRGGENISPREVEEFLYRCPGVKDVQVFGAPDAIYGEELCAWIVPTAPGAVTDAAVRDYCRGQIAHFKIPRHIRFVESFPLTVTGKAQKFRMREIMAAELAGERADQ